VQDTRRKNGDVVRRPLKQPKSATLQEFSVLQFAIQERSRCLRWRVSRSRRRKAICQRCAALSSGRRTSVGTVRATFYNWTFV